MNKKGNSFAFLAAVILLFILGGMYLLLRQATDQVYAITDNTDYGWQGSDFENSIEQTYTMFKWYPIIILLVLFLWVTIESLRRKGEYFA